MRGSFGFSKGCAELAPALDIGALLLPPPVATFLIAFPPCTVLEQTCPIMFKCECCWNIYETDLGMVRFMWAFLPLLRTKSPRKNTERHISLEVIQLCTRDQECNASAVALVLVLRYKNETSHDSDRFTMSIRLSSVRWQMQSGAEGLAQLSSYF